MGNSNSSNGDNAAAANTQTDAAAATTNNAATEQKEPAAAAGAEGGAADGAGAGKEVDPAAMNPNQQLLYGASSGNKELVRAAMEKGADINYLDNTVVIAAGDKPDDPKYANIVVSGDGALHKAAEKGHVEVVKLLFFLSADLELQNRLGSTALHRAVSNNRLETVQFLLSKGARIDASNCAGNTPLHCAAYAGHVAVMRTLLENGANKIIGKTNKANMTAADYARKAPIKALLAEFGVAGSAGAASIDAANTGAATAAHAISASADTADSVLTLDDATLTAKPAPAMPEVHSSDSEGVVAAAAEQPAAVSSDPAETS